MELAFHARKPIEGELSHTSKRINNALAEVFKTLVAEHLLNAGKTDVSELYFCELVIDPLDLTDAPESFTAKLVDHHYDEEGHGKSFEVTVKEFTVNTTDLDF